MKLRTLAVLSVRIAKDLEKCENSRHAVNIALSIYRKLVVKAKVGSSLDMNVLCRSWVDIYRFMWKSEPIKNIISTLCIVRNHQIVGRA